MNISQIESEEIKKSLGLSEYIILYLGMIENRKNILGILKIADEVLKENKQIKFLLIGKIGYGGKRLLEEINKRENVVHLKSVENQLLKKIYNISFAFLFPSFHEGFGYPPLEAMQSGLPVLASNNTSLKEIINGGGLLHDPLNYSSFIEDIFKLLKNKDYYRQVRENGLERAKEFNINKTVKEFVNTFNSII